jgi:hypothetical protein
MPATQNIGKQPSLEPLPATMALVPFVPLKGSLPTVAG